MKMTAVGESDPNLATKCLDFCQALSSQGVAFNFSLSVGSTFSFSLDTRGKAPLSTGTKKKSSPSTLRRNARRRKEFLEKKRNSAAANPSEEPAVDSLAPTCNQCEYKAASEKGLRQHTRMKHKPEILREEPDVSLNLSQPSEIRDDESVNADLSITTITGDLVIPHFCGPNMTRFDDSGDQSVFACDSCFHLWRTEEEVHNCLCTNRHNCSPYCLYVDVLPSTKALISR